MIKKFENKNLCLKRKLTELEDQVKNFAHYDQKQIIFYIKLKELEDIKEKAVLKYQVNNFIDYTQN
jgi:hypothetical protein